MQRDTDVVTTKILSDIKSLRESFNKPASEEQKNVIEMSERISTGIYLVTQHLSESTNIKMSLRNCADEIINVVYGHSTGNSDSILELLNLSDKTLSFIKFAKISQYISEINSLLIEREVLKLERLLTIMITNEDSHKLQFNAKDRQDTKLKLFDLFAGETEEEDKKTKVINKGQSIQKKAGTKSKNDSENKKTENTRNSSKESNSIEIDYKGHDNDVSNEVTTKEYIKDISSGVERFEKESSSVTATSMSEKLPQPTDTEVKRQDNYIRPIVDTPKSEIPKKVTKVERKPRSSGATSAIEERRQNVLNTIKLNGIISIKEISDSITDVSEKTLQRTLTDLVNDGLVIRHGDRRWSKYEAIL